MVSTPARTMLFVPADRPDRYAKAAESDADAIIIDLEDAVAPKTKAAARKMLCVPHALPQGIDIFVRLNGRSTPWYDADVAAVSLLPVAGVILPKTETVTDITALASRFGDRVIIALIETARGLSAAREIARAPSTTRLAFGSIDFCADIGAAHTRDALLAARSEIVLASRLAGIAPPLDGVTTSLDDAALIENDARHASELGFGGKLCIHPRQIAPVWRGFLPSTEEIAWARRVLDAEGQGAASVDGAMVDAPVRARARTIIARASAATSSHDRGTMP